jgi:hypothetical protein
MTRQSMARDIHELRLFFSNYLMDYSIHTHPVRDAYHASRQGVKLYVGGSHGQWWDDKTAHQFAGLEKESICQDEGRTVLVFLCPICPRLQSGHEPFQPGEDRRPGADPRGYRTESERPAQRTHGLGTGKRKMASAWFPSIKRIFLVSSAPPSCGRLLPAWGAR